MSYRVALGADHGGFSLKDDISAHIEQSHLILDVGAHSFDPDDDYPEYAEAVARAVASGQAMRGILICGSGVGACIAANKVVGVRACLCHDTYTAHQGVEHADMNILCLGARVIGPEMARELVTAFLGAAFSSQERHKRRRDKVLAIERRSLEGVRSAEGGRSP